MDPTAWIIAAASALGGGWAVWRTAIERRARREEKQIDSEQNLISRLWIRIDALEAKSVRMEERIGELERHLADERTKSFQLQDELHHAKREVEDLAADNAELRSQILEMEKDRLACVERIATLTGELEQARGGTA
jgi:chromosome segregation ATPase